MSVYKRFGSIMPTELGKYMLDNTYIAGGAIVNFLIKQPIADYDMFIVSDEARDRIRGWFVEQDWNQEGRDWRIKALTQNAVTVAFDSGEVIQLVTRFTGYPERVFKSFDFEHCKAYFVPSTDTLLYNEDMIMNKKLVYTGEDDYPLNTMKRLVKFIRRGWDIDNESILNLAKKMSRTKLDDPEIYKEQVIGFYGSSMR